MLICGKCEFEEQCSLISKEGAVAETQLKIRAAVPVFTPFQAYSDIKQKTAPRGAVSLCIIYALF